MKDYEIICTIGPSCEDSDTLKNLKTAGVDIFRVNMSHATIEELEKFCNLSKKLGLKLGIDTEGAQIRTKNFKNRVLKINKKDRLKVPRDQEQISDEFLMTFYPFYVLDNFKVGMKLRLDFNGALAEVVEISSDYIIMECICSGYVGNNKGVDILNNIIELHDFTEKDLQALELGRKKGIDQVFISFCKSSKAVLHAKSLIPDARIISKIESKLSIHNLNEICKVSDALLIDRGDLTREINIMDIPFAQRGIVKTALEKRIPCFVATNVLESLIDGKLPTRAELNDIVSTLEMGSAGIVLAAETAIGSKPVLCAEIVNELMHRFELYKTGLLFADIERNEITDDEMRLWLNR